MTIEQSPVTILGDLIEQLESKIDQCSSLPHHHYGSGIFLIGNTDLGCP
jgi:hypothetical protein